MSKRLQVYHTDDLVVTFDPNVCAHSGVCLGSLPGVFDVSRQRWIDLAHGTADQVVATVARCPSGALRTVRAGQPAPAAPVTAAVTITTQPNASLRVIGPVEVVRENGEKLVKEKCSLCRCGHTKNAPFCDATHKTIGFVSPS